MIVVDDVEIYATLDRGNLWCMIRATNKVTFEAQALAVGLMSHETTDASGALVPTAGVTITQVGPLVLVPAVLDAEGEVITPAVMDNRHHVNFWLDAATVSHGAWLRWATAWTYYGGVIIPNSAEDGSSLYGIELIDPDTVKNPRNVML